VIQLIAGNTHFALSLVIFGDNKPAGLKKHLLYIFIFWLLAATSFGQTAKQYSFSHYGTAAGLAANFVQQVVQDKQGYIWIATNNGLQRFDGNRYLTFQKQKNNPRAIPGNFITQMLLDNKDNLWLVTAGGHLGFFDTKWFEYHEAKVKLKDPTIQTRIPHGIVRDEEGNIFLNFQSHEFLTWNEKKQEFSAEYNFIPELSSWKIIDFKQEPGTSKYWIARDNGLAVYDKATKQLSYAGHNEAKEPIIDKLGHVLVPAGVFIDQQKRFWFYTWWTRSAPAVYAFDMVKGEEILHDYSLYTIYKFYHEVYGFFQQKDGSLWVNGLGVFAQFNEKDKSFVSVLNGYSNERSIDYNMVRNLYEDRERNVWVSTNNNGLYRFDPASQFFTNIRQFNRYHKIPGDGSVMSFLYTKKGTLLVGAWSDGLYQFDSGFNMISVKELGFKDEATPWIWDMNYSRDSSIIWMASQPGIFQVNPATRSYKYHNPAILENKTIRQVEVDRFDNMWLGSQSLGLFKWTPAKGKKNFEEGITKYEGVPRSGILKIHIDKRGYVWVCSGSYGVYVIDPANDKVIMHFGVKEPAERKLLWDGSVGVIDYDDSTMVIASNGLYVFNTRQQKITKTIPLPESVAGLISSIERDREGYIWMSMTEGLFRVNLRNEIFIHFDRVDGIANDNFVIAASSVLPDGKILLGADNQTVVFDPSNVRINNPAPDVTITGFRLMNESLLIDSLLLRNRVELGPDDNSVAIEFSGLTYNGTYIIKYKLENLDKDWVRADKTNTAVYSFLPPGTYTFMAFSEDAEGNPSKNVVKLVIKVKPPFWKTWWFLGLVIFAATAVLFWLDKLRMQRIRATESVRTRIATSLTEDMSNSLTNINISSELAKTKIDVDVPRTKEYISQISETSNRMVQSMYDMVWSIDPKNDTMSNTIERMKSYATETEHNFPISIDFDIDRQVEKPGLDMEHRYELLCIYKEAVTNAGKHSGGRHVKVSLRYNNSNLIMVIIDDGKGFLMTEAAMLGRGMSDMRRRAAAINAMLYIESEINTGTVVKLEMPV
jgi:signal transduction histidine kinase/ligand-binding sensor domain-containing protein